MPGTIMGRRLTHEARLICPNIQPGAASFNSACYTRLCQTIFGDGFGKLREGSDRLNRLSCGRLPDGPQAATFEQKGTSPRPLHQPPKISDWLPWRKLFGIMMQNGPTR